MRKLSAAVTLFVTVLVAHAAAGATLDRTLTFAPDRVHLATHDGVTEVRVDGAAPSADAGQPELPWLAEAIDLPEGMQVESIQVTASEFVPLATSGIRLPSGWTLTRGSETPMRSTPDPRAFTRAGAQPARPAELALQGFQRGRSRALLKVCPVRWDASTGRLDRLAKLSVRLTLVAATSRPVSRLRVVPEWEDGATSGPLRNAALSPLAQGGGFGGRSAEGTLSATQLPSLLGSPVQYVIVTNDDMAAQYQRLADWKTQSGVPAVVRTMSFIRTQYPRGSDDAERVRDFIRDAYSRWGTKWVLLGGDTDVLPERLARNTYFGGENIASDLYFSCLDGNWDGNGNWLYCEPGDNADLLPEVYVGRAPTSTVNDAQMFVDRTLAYEKTPVGDYERNVIMFAEVLFPEDWEPGQSVLLDGGVLGDELLPYIAQNPSMRTTRLYQNHTAVWAPPQPYPESRAAVIDSLNKGYNFAVQIGHGYRNVMSLGDANIFNGDALGLANGGRYANLYAVTCTSNAIDFPCIGEAFMKAQAGGAVTSVGSTRLDFPYAARSFEKEYFRLLFDDSTTALGEAQAKQKLPQLINSTTDNAYRWEQQALVLLGDPELRAWTGTPRTLGVTAPASYALSDTQITVGVITGGQPLRNARVTAWKAGDAYRSVLTDVNGVAKLSFRIDSLGTIQLTVTGYDCRPYQATIPVTAAAGVAVLGDAGVAIDDDAVSGTSGDADAIADAGETVDYRVTIANTGGTGASGVTATLSSGDANVTVIGPSVPYGTVGAGAAVTPSGAFRLAISAACPDQREVPLTLTITDASAKVRVRTLYLTVRAPDLRHFAHDITDLGDHDGVPDAGEVVTYVLHLKNLGTAEGHAVSAVIRNYDGNATVSDSVATFGDVASQQDKTADGVTFALIATTAKLELRVSDSHGLRFTRMLDVVPPEMVGSLTGTGEPTSAVLVWAPGEDADLYGYNVYRSLASGGPFARVTPVPTDRISTYEDAPLTPLTRYYFKVSAVDSSGNESVLSPVADASTNPPTHTTFPIPMNAPTVAPAAADHVYPGWPLDIAAGSDVLYAWHPDGTAPIDADGAGATSGDITTRARNYEGGPSLADLNGDGQKEFLGVASDSTQVVAVKQDGSTLAGWPQKITDRIWSSVAVGDIDNDGSPELVFGSYGGARMFAFHGNGTEVLDGDANATTNGVFRTLGKPFNIGTPAIADIDNSGTSDVLYGGFDGKVYAWRADGSLLPGFPITLPEAITASVAVGYLDGPGDPTPEIVVQTGFYPNATPAKDSLYVFKSDGGRRAGFPKQLKASDNNKAPSPAIADMNADGFADVVGAGTDGRIYVFDRNGAAPGPWAGGKAYSTATTYASEASPSVADIDGDGVNDVVMGDESGELMALSGVTGAPMPGFPIHLGSGIKSAPVLCDCDGDGKTEIILAGEDKNVHMWDYDFPFSPGQAPAWPQFHHDARRTGFASSPAFLSVESPPPAASPIAARLELAVPAPNPTRGASLLTFAIPKVAPGDRMELAVYDLTGRQVKVLQNGDAHAGTFRTTWNLADQSGRRVEAGLYFARLTVGRDVRSQKLIVVR